jgi:hypothetical protein
MLICQGFGILSRQYLFKFSFYKKEQHMNDPIEKRPPTPPFTRETAIQKVRMAEDGWNSRDPQRVSLVYTPDSQWRNRAEFSKGREEIVAFLTRNGQKNSIIV